MGYGYCMEKAGAEILESADFGDWQGTSYYVVRYKGDVKLISIYYGSCGGCDSYQGWYDDFPIGKIPSDEDYAEFGRSYLEGPCDFQQELKRAKKDCSWDLEGDKLVAFLESVAHYFPHYGSNVDYSFGKGPT